MKHLSVAPMDFFKVLTGTERSQVATMVLETGQSTGGPQNRHEGSDQWIFVIEGAATAVVKGEKVHLNEGSLLLIEAGETHEIVNNRNEPFRTLNFYSPPVY